MASLTVEELREHVTSALEDEPLQRLLDAAWQAITKVAGPETASAAVLDGGYSYLTLPRRASAITQIIEWFGLSGARVLTVGNYRLSDDGISIRRLTSGDLASDYWVGPVQVEYVAADDEAERQVVQIALVRLFLNHHPGSTSEQIGDWQETFAANSVFNYAIERDAILATLAPTGALFA